MEIPKIGKKPLDVDAMLANAMGSIRKQEPQIHTVPEPSPNPQGRILDPGMYGAQIPEVTKERGRGHVTISRVDMPALTSAKLEEYAAAKAAAAAYDEIFRPIEEPRVVPQAISPREVSVRRVVTPIEVVAPQIYTDKVDLIMPAPDTADAVLFGNQIRRAQEIIDQDLADGYQPQLLISEFDPRVIALICEMKPEYAPYFVAEARPRTSSEVTHLIAQAKAIASGNRGIGNSSQSNEYGQSNNNPLLSLRQLFDKYQGRDKSKSKSKVKKIILGATASAAAALSLFTVGYVGSRETVCSSGDVGSKLACLALAGNTIPISATPVVNTVVSLLKMPIEAYYSGTAPDPESEVKR